MAAAARNSPAAPGAAERAYRYTTTAGGDDADRRRALGAWRALGQPRRINVTDELSLVAFGAPPTVVIELDHVAPDGARDQHNHGLRLDAVRALLERTTARAVRLAGVVGAFEVVSRSGGGAAVRFGAGIEAVLDPEGLRALRDALADAASGGGSEPAPGRNDPCPCGSAASTSAAAACSGRARR